MARKRSEISGPPVRSGPQSPEPGLSGDDEDALEMFCSGVALEDIDLETWKNLHHSLDIEVPLFLTPDQARHGGPFKVCFTRQIFQDNVRNRADKEKANHGVLVPAQSKGGQRLRFSGLGDRRSNDCGDLTVIIRIKE